MIRYGRGADPLFNAFRKIIDEKEVVYHDRMPREELAKYYRSADLVLGQFNPVYANFSLVELETMACGAPIVTLDKYEIKKEFNNLNRLENLAFRLLENKEFRQRFMKRNLEYVKKMHGEREVAQINIKHINSVLKKRKSLSNMSKNL